MVGETFETEVDMNTKETAQTTSENNGSIPVANIQTAIVLADHIHDKKLLGVILKDPGVVDTGTTTQTTITRRRPIDMVVDMVHHRRNSIEVIP